MFLSDHDLREYIGAGLLVIRPISEETIRENGVDLRFGNEFCLSIKGQMVLDTRKSLSADIFYDCKSVDDGSGFTIPPGRRVLATTGEWVELPNDIIGLVNLRSSFARTGLYIPPTVIDAGFRGEITIEIVGADYPVRVYPGQRFLHVVFAKLRTPSEKGYSGSYQWQRGVTLPRLPIR